MIPVSRPRGKEWRFLTALFIAGEDDPMNSDPD
ncbi:hypothetical protein E2C01_074136 [Portunus trituberculatus]|uniref:Uncharacterized protein n=1 Tax=Portunus trituberculatus TaxID=210409 RepID=A0A5B7I4X8_PORTR|nr:hypothetical protein [Portunus trituberculatus]